MTPEPQPEQIATYRRLLKQGGSPSQIVPAVTICGTKIPDIVSGLLAKAGYEISLHSAKREEDLKMDFESAGATCLIAGHMGQPLAAVNAPSETAQIVSNGMLGADLEGQETEPDRPLSPFESAAFEVFCGYFAKALNLLCSRTDLTILKGEQAQEKEMPQTTTAAIKVVIPVGKAAIGLSVTIAHELLLKVPLPTANAKPANQKMPEGALRRVQSALKAEICVSSYSLTDVSKLKEGQSLMLGPLTAPLVTLSTGRRKLYECSIGQSGNSYAIRIERPYQALAAAVSSEPDANMAADYDMPTS